MASADRTAVVLIRHPGIARAEVADVLIRRWPDAIIGDVGSLSPTWEFAIEDAVELARARRGVEPLRVVVLAQRASNVDVGAVERGPKPPIEPMPIVV
jgi:flavin-binding protein dodecin